MATVSSSTYPGTPFSIKANKVEIGGKAVFEVFAEAHGSGEASTPRRYKSVGEIEAFLTGATDVDTGQIQAFVRSLAESGFAEISEVWLLDAQAARFRIHISRG
jgi:hypothetical protein